MSTMEVLIGYDVRKADKVEWNVSRRETFLINESVENILSVDRAVWSSLFYELDIELPANIGWVSGLWANLNRLQAHTASSRLSDKQNYWTVGFTQYFDKSVIDDRGLTTLPFSPSTIQDDWTFLGYDIAEQTLLSGLSNMGYRKEDKSFAITNFAHHLNSNHLFHNFAAAQEFARWNQVRDVGHGPWFVTGIYHIPE